jgi:hypothetical protein
VLDLGGTRSVDSAGLELAVLWHRRSCASASASRWCRDRPRSTAAFETAGLVGRLRFIDPD